MDRELADVGRRIAEERRARGFTQAQLAEKVDCTERFLSSVESRGVNVTLAWLIRVARELHVPLRQLFDPPQSRTRPRRGRPRTR